jgi:NACalpha-BTF3-like transcription factor
MRLSYMLTSAVADELKGFYGDLDEYDIELVVAQAGVEREVAAQALRTNDNDIVDAIMSLT